MGRNYRLVPYHELPHYAKEEVWQKYPNGVEWIPRWEYMYPLRVNGTLAPAPRRISLERAQELKEIYDVRKVMEE